MRASCVFECPRWTTRLQPRTAEEEIVASACASSRAVLTSGSLWPWKDALVHGSKVWYYRLPPLSCNAMRSRCSALSSWHPSFGVRVVDSWALLFRVMRTPLRTDATRLQARLARLAACINALVSAMEWIGIHRCWEPRPAAVHRSIFHRL